MKLCMSIVLLGCLSLAEVGNLHAAGMAKRRQYSELLKISLLRRDLYSIVSDIYSHTLGKHI